MIDLPFIIFGLVTVFLAVLGSRNAVRRFAAALKDYSPDTFQKFNNPLLTVEQNQRNLRGYLHSQEYDRLGIPLVTHLGRRAAYRHAIMFVLAFTTVPCLTAMFCSLLFQLK